MTRFCPANTPPACRSRCASPPGSSVRASASTRSFRPASRLAQALEQLGPSAIKLGQFLATRPDILGADIARGLETLQDRLPPFAETEARRIVEAELGRPLSRAVRRIRPTRRGGLDRAGPSGDERRTIRRAA